MENERFKKLGKFKMSSLREKIEFYQKILPQERQRLEEMKNSRVQNVIRKAWNNYQIKKLEAWIFYHEEKLQNWKNQCHDGFD